MDLATVSGQELAHLSDQVLLPANVSILRCHQPNNPYSPLQTFHVLGTAHVSKQSCEDVKQLIRAVRPQVVMVELCAARKDILTMKEAKIPSMKEMLHNWRHGNTNAFNVLYAWVLASVGEHLEVLPGEEFRAAVEVAAEVDALVVLGDRPLNVTVARLWAGLSGWEKVRLTWELLVTGLFLPDAHELEEMVEEMKGNADMLTAMVRELGKDFPSLLPPLIDERDEYMVATMRGLATRASSVVAIVGGGHLPGIRGKWDADIDIERIMELPQKPRGFFTRRKVLLIAGGITLSSVAVVTWQRRWR